MNARQMLAGLPVHMAEGGSVSNEQIRNWFIQNPDATDAQIAAAMDRNGVTTTQLATAMGYNPEVVAQRYAAQTMASPQPWTPGESAGLLRARQSGLSDQQYYGYVGTAANKWLANPGTAAEAFDAMVKSGISVSDLLNSGISQGTIDKAYTIPTDAAQQQVNTTALSSMTSMLAQNPLIASAIDQRGIQDIYAGAKNYVAKLQQDGLTEAERNQLRQAATAQGWGYADIRAAGIDPTILFQNAVPNNAFPPFPPAVPYTPVNAFPPAVPYTPVNVYQPLTPQPDIYAPGQPALDVAFRESAPRTAIPGMPGSYEYTPAASLRPATGAGYSWTPPMVTSRPRSLLSPTLLSYVSPSQQFAQSRASQDQTLLGAFRSSGLPQNASNFYSWRNRLRSGEFGAGSAFNPNAFQSAFSSWAASQAPGTTDQAPVGDVTGYAEIAGSFPLRPVDLRTIPTFAEGGEASAEEMLRQIKKTEGTEAPSLGAEAPRNMVLENRNRRRGRAGMEAYVPHAPAASMLENIIRGGAEIPGTVGRYAERVAASESPLGKVGTDIANVGGALWEGAKENPVSFAMDVLPLIGEIRSGIEADKYTKLANEAAAQGNPELARIYQELVTLSAAGTVPAAGMLARVGGRTAKKAALEAAEKAAKEAAERAALGTEDVTARQMLENLTPAEPAPVADEALPAPPVEQAPTASAVGHGLSPELLVPGTGAMPEFKVVQSFSPNNKAATLQNIDAVEEMFPDPLESTQRWMDAEGAAFGGDYLPAPPRQAVIYRQDPARLASLLDKLTPDLKAAVDEGYSYVNSIKNLYNSRIAPPEMTGRLFLWGILSRGAGPAQQEGAFLDILQNAAPFIQKSARGEFTETDLNAWKKMVSESIPEGSPGKQVTMNANAAGNLLYQLGQSTEGGPSALSRLHDILSDPQRSGREFRREFYNSTNNPGIDNKVVSFIGLVSGKPDLLVMDRIQSRHLWDDGTYGGANIYDGLDKGGLNKILTGPRGLMVTEMLESGLSEPIKKAYAMVGRPQDASTGRMHWETWLISSNQPVSHSTLQAVRSGSPIGYSVTEGKRNTFSSNMTYRQTVNGPIVEYPLSTGEIARMTPLRQKEFEDFIRNKQNGILPDGFMVSQSTDRPWFEQSGIDRRKLDEAARRFENVNPDGSLRSGDARDSQGRGAVSQRRAQFLTDFRRDKLSLATAERGLPGGPDGPDLSQAAGPYTREAVGPDGGNGLLSFTPDRTALRQYESAGLYAPVVRQVPSENASSFAQDMARAMSKNSTAPQVEMKSPEELAGYRLFQTEAGSGFAIKPDGDIVSVFASPAETRGSSYAMLQAAVQAGGRKLDAFDTYLPDISQKVGFKPVARIPWNEEFAPAGWNKQVFSEYNNGEPDIVFFVHDPNYFGEDIEVPYAKDYEDAVRMQGEALSTTPGGAAPSVESMQAHQAGIQTAEQLFSQATAANPLFQETIGDLAASVGAQYKAGPVKTLESINDKLARKQSSPANIQDSIRSTILIGNNRQANEAAQRIASQFPTVDEGWVRNPANGYFDRKLSVQFTGPNNERLIGEVQITTPEMLRAKDTQGHALYKIERDLVRAYRETARMPPQEYIKLIRTQTQARDLYERAARQAHPSILGVITEK